MNERLRRYLHLVVACISHGEISHREISSSPFPRLLGHSCSPRLSHHVGLALIVCLLGLVAPLTSANAEFVQTSAGVYQSSDRTTKVVISHRTPGIFILMGNPIDLQLFDPSQITLGVGDEAANDPVHVFIEYDARVDRYTAVHVGNRSFRVKGGFTITSGSEPDEPRLRITVDNNNPYLSIVLESSASAAPDILGFRGLQLVVRRSGQRSTALLEANQLNQLKGLIEPYTLVPGDLHFKGVPLRTTSIGVEAEPAKNPCLQGGVTFLTKEAAAGLRETTDKSAALKELERLLKEGTKDPFLGVLLLRVEAHEIIGLDYRKERAIVVRPLPRATHPVCLVEEVSLD